MKGGKTLNDRKLAADVRTIGLRQIKFFLESLDDNDIFKRQLLLKLAPTLLPRINEHSGNDGQPINILFDNAFKGREEN